MSMSVSASASIHENAGTLTASVRVIANFAVQHLSAACVFRNRCIQIEANLPALDQNLAFSDLRSYASSTLMSCAAGLEALINELFIAHGGKLRNCLPDFEGTFWGPKGIERKPPLDKFDVALQLLKLPPLQKTASLYRDAWCLIELRNALVHFKPTWDPVSRRRVELEQVLAGRYPLSPFGDPKSDFVTMRSMGAGCATWAVASTLSFLREFDRHANIDKDKMVGVWALEA